MLRRRKGAAAPQDFKDARPFVPLVSLSLPSLCPFSHVFDVLVVLESSRVSAYLSGRWVTCHLQARRKACTARVKRSETLPYRLSSALTP